MRILVVGGGGREHALVWKLRRDEPSLDLLAAPGNPGIAPIARCIPVAATDVGALVALAVRERVDVVVVGPEAPLAAGLVDRLRSTGVAAFGPTRAAARIETSKRFAKELMLRAGVPTAPATWHTDAAEARRAARALGTPVVVKASGLAAGKGVVVCDTLDEADGAIEAMLDHGALGDAGREVLVEECMTGEELSVLVLTDGERVLRLPAAQDHKRLLEGDRGPNTGGMGAYAPVSVATDALSADIEQRILRPTLDALREHGAPFTGLLYAGLMLTPDGPRVVEFNCRFGDPETETLLPLLQSSLLDPLVTIATGGALGPAPLAWQEACSVTTVVASAGYPHATPAPSTVSLPNGVDDVLVFHAGTARDAAGALLATGGRVLALTAVGDSLDGARERTLAVADAVALAGKHYRRDIGWRELTRAGHVPARLADPRRS